MNIENNYSKLNFQAKFLQTKDLYDITGYAVKKGKFFELNKARKLLEACNPKTRVAINLCYTGNKPTIIFSHYTPKYGSSGMFTDEFVLANQVDIVAKKADEDILKFALRKIISLAKQGSKSSQYKDIFKKADLKETCIWI